MKYGNAIHSDDPQAIEKLKSKLEELENSQKLMKSINAYYRKRHTLHNCPGISDDYRAKLEHDMENRKNWGQGRAPFEGYELTNNNASIRTAKKRIEELECLAANPPEGWRFDGGEVVANKELGRLQIMFDEKPGKEICNELSHNGFHWAPSQNAWQRKLTQNAVRSLKWIKAVQPSNKKEEPPC